MPVGFVRFVPQFLRVFSLFRQSRELLALRLALRVENSRHIGSTVVFSALGNSDSEILQVKCDGIRPSESAK